MELTSIKIYATSEERKQRNRQAQAAFRERRTEYIKQLEATIKQNETSLATLQQNHRSAADECLMLRYKNSLLERILLEKGVSATTTSIRVTYLLTISIGIDVQAELQIKAGSPTFPASMMPSTTSHPQPARAPLQRTAMQRHHARRSASIITSGIEGPTMPAHEMSAQSPQASHTPASHISSPSTVSTRSPTALHTGVSQHALPAHHAQVNLRSQPHMASISQISTSTPLPQSATSSTSSARSRQHASASRQPLPPTMLDQQPTYISPGSDRGSHPHRGLLSTPLATPTHDEMAESELVQSASAYYPSPFQKHIDQLGKFLRPLLYRTVFVLD